MPDADAPPIIHTVTLACSPQHAFSAYTEQISAWWDPRYTANPDTLEAVTIEPSVGGRVYATHRDIGRHDWGEVTAWEPGRRLVHSFTLAQDPAYPSEVAIDFEPAATRDGCTVRLVHGGWGAANLSARQKFGDWPLILARFAALANPESRTIFA